MKSKCILETYLLCINFMFNQIKMISNSYLCKWKIKSIYIFYSIVIVYLFVLLANGTLFQLLALLSTTIHKNVDEMSIVIIINHLELCSFYCLFALIMFSQFLSLLSFPPSNLFITLLGVK